MDIKPGLYKCWDGTIYRVYGIKIIDNVKHVVYGLNITTQQNGGYEPAKYIIGVREFLEPVLSGGKWQPRFTPHEI